MGNDGYPFNSMDGWTYVQTERRTQQSLYTSHFVSGGGEMYKNSNIGHLSGHFKPLFKGRHTICDMCILLE